MISDAAQDETGMYVDKITLDHRRAHSWSLLHELRNELLVPESMTGLAGVFTWLAWLT